MYVNYGDGTWKEHACERNSDEKIVHALLTVDNGMQDSPYKREEWTEYNPRGEMVHRLRKSTDIDLEEWFDSYGRCIHSKLDTSDEHVDTIMMASYLREYTKTVEYCDAKRTSVETTSEQKKVFDERYEDYLEECLENPGSYSEEHADEFIVDIN